LLPRPAAIAAACAGRLLGGQRQGLFPKRLGVLQSEG